MSPGAKKASNHGETDTKLMEMLVCPLTHAVLHHDREKNELISRPARLAYPVRGGIPIMLASEARQLDDDEYKN